MDLQVYIFNAAIVILFQISHVDKHSTEGGKILKIQQKMHIFAPIKIENFCFCLFVCVRVLHIDLLKVLYAPPTEKAKSMTLVLWSSST